MALVLILSGLLPALASAGWALGTGAGFLAVLAAYTGGGFAGMLGAALTLALARRLVPRGLELPTP